MPKVTLSISQLRCLESPIRLELLRVLIDLKSANVSQISKFIGRSPATTMYHLDLLQRAKLVKSVGKRPSKHKPETWFAPVAFQFVLPKGNTKTLQQINHKSILNNLKHTSNLFKKISIVDANVLIINRQVRLSNKNLKAFYKMIETASEFADKNKDPNGKLIQCLSFAFIIPNR